MAEDVTPENGADADTRRWPGRLARAIGTSICGVSAIVAAKGAIRARNADVGYAIAAILALGAVALFALPPSGHAFGLTDHEFGLWAGLSVDNTAETTATGYLYSDHAGKIAVLVKSTRNALIGFVVLGFALYLVRCRWASCCSPPGCCTGVQALSASAQPTFVPPSAIRRTALRKTSISSNVL